MLPISSTILALIHSSVAAYRNGYMAAKYPAGEETEENGEKRI